MRYPNSATAAASRDEIQTLKRMIKKRGYSEGDQRNRHDDGLFRQSEVPCQHHLFPNDGSLALRDECVVGTVGKLGEGLSEGVSEVGTGCVEILQGNGVVDVAVGVEFVAASAKVGRGHGLGDAAQKRGSEIDDLGNGEAELASGGLVGVRRPGRFIVTGDIFGVSIINAGGVAGGVDFLCCTSAVILPLVSDHTYQEDVDTVL